LFFEMRNRTLMSVAVRTSPRIEAETPKTLFQLPPTLGRGSFTWAPSADGKRLLILRSDQPDLPAQINVVVNWSSELKQQ